MFKDYFGIKAEEFAIDSISTDAMTESAASQIEKIQKSGIKIKTMNPTKFGFEVTFYKEQDAIDAAKAAGTTKIDGKSIFVDA